jgi:hypothetical protein
MEANPHEVANCLKVILRNLSEPVCPFALYPRFRDLSKTQSKEDRFEEIIELLQLMPTLNRNLLIHLARFFSIVCSHSEDNKMPAYNLAVVVTPNLFYSKDLTPKDL